MHLDEIIINHIGIVARRVPVYFVEDLSIYNQVPGYLTAEAPEHQRNMSRENIPPFRSPTPSRPLSKTKSLALGSNIHPSHLVQE